MPTYSYRVRKPEPVVETVVERKVVVERKFTRPSATRVTTVSRPSVAKTVEHIPRPRRESSSDE